MQLTFHKTGNNLPQSTTIIHAPLLPLFFVPAAQIPRGSAPNPPLFTKSFVEASTKPHVEAIVEANIQFNHLKTNKSGSSGSVEGK